MCKCVLPPGDSPIAVNKYIIYSECVFVALLIHYTKWMRCIIRPAVTIPRVPYFSTSFYKLDDNGGEGGYNFCLKHFTVKRIQRDIIINVRVYSYKVPVIVGRF